MIPIRDTTPCRNYPVINNALIVFNVFIYFYQLGQGAELNRFLYTYGLVPARYSDPGLSGQFSFVQQSVAFISFMFLHGGFWHLLGNMWSLYIFGDNVEDRLGPVRYLLFYLVCGIASGLSHFLLYPESNAPVIGASGAIAGVMGAYFILYPSAKVLTFVPIFFIPYFFEVPAFIFLGIWFLFQFLGAAGSTGSSVGIAWWAHVGGFLCGIIFLKVALAIPSSGFTERMRRLTAKKKTTRLQVIRPISPHSDGNLYGTISITPFEAFAGTTKLVNIPRGFQKRLFNVKVPPGIAAGTVLRLRGLGEQSTRGQRGDLMLKVSLQS